jgi:hypothetical protein
LLSLEQVIVGLNQAVATNEEGRTGNIVNKSWFWILISEVRLDPAAIPPSSNVVYEVEV